MSCKNHKMNRYHIKCYKENAKTKWGCMCLWQKLITWKLSYKKFENYYVKQCLQSRRWKYGNYKEGDKEK